MALYSKNFLDDAEQTIYDTAVSACVSECAFVYGCTHRSVKTFGSTITDVHKLQTLQLLSIMNFGGGGITFKVSFYPCGMFNKSCFTRLSSVYVG